MPLSTSSSDQTATPNGAELRKLPALSHCGFTLLVVTTLTTCAVTAREWQLARKGYIATLSLHQGLWARQRNLLSKASPGQTVVIGSSRIKFGFDLEEWARQSDNSKPFMLAWPGGCPRPSLHDLAEDGTFEGKVICGYTPGLFFCSNDDHFALRTKPLADYAQRWGPAEKTSQMLRLLLEPRLRILLQTEVSPIEVARSRLALGRRAGTIPTPRLPAFAFITQDNRTRIHDWFLTDVTTRKQVTGAWQAATSQAAFYSPADTNAILESTRKDVAKIRARGGDVVFIRFPSTNWFRELERQNFPRQLYWERLLEATGCLGIHFEDYPELARFDCPEWSHLSQDDALLFTRGLYKILHQP
jgi:hypothetical protein